jgi:hypothetical protein
MADAIAQRMSGQPVNILAYSWSGAYTVSPELSHAHAFHAGRFLAKELARLLPGYAGPIHIIGHSHGTIVNAVAVDASGLRVDHFTMLDPPLVQPFLSAGTYHRYLAEGAVGYVDNFLASDPCPSWLQFPLGGVVAGAAPNGGRTIPGRTHCDIDDWYTDTVSNGSVQEGFYHSRLLAHFDDKPGPAEWRHPVERLYLTTPMMVDTRVGGNGDFRAIEGSPQDVSLFVLGQSRDSNILLLEQSPSSATVDLTIPGDAGVLAFDFVFSQPGDGDWLTVLFNDVLLFASKGLNSTGADFHQIEVPVAHVAGQTGTLTVRLQSVGDPDAEVIVSNFRFLAEAEVTLVAPTLLTFALDGGAPSTMDRTVALTHAGEGAADEYRASESSTFDGAAWIPYTSEPVFTLSAGNGSKSVYFQIRNSAGASSIRNDTITLSEPAPTVTTFTLNGGSASTASRAVTLTSAVTGSPTEYQASESSNFAGATWLAYAPAPAFTLSAGNGSKRVYFRVRNVAGVVSTARNDTITLSE